MSRGVLRPTVTVLVIAGVVAAVNYLRDAAVVVTMGAGSGADAFFSALLLPTVIAQTLVPSTVTPAFVPVYQGLRRESRRAGAALLGGVGAAVVSLLLLATVPALTWTRPLVSGLLPGFDAATLDLTTRALRWMLPAVPLLALAAVGRATLNAHERFAIPAAVPVLPAVAILAVLVAGATEVTVLAAAAAAGMAAQLAAIAVGTWRARVPVALPRGPGASPALRRVGALAVPMALAVGCGSLPTVLERWWASQLGVGTVAHVTLVQRIVGLPMLLLGGSVATVLFPRLAAVAGERDRLAATLAEGLRLVAPPLLVCTAWLVGSADTVVALLYRHGAFTVADAAATAHLLRFYALGLPAAGLWMVLTKALAARQDVWVHAAVVVVLVPIEVVLLAVLVPILGAAGLGASLSAGSWLAAAMMVVALARRHRAMPVDRASRELLAWMPATVAAGIAAALVDVPAGGAGVSGLSLLGRLAAGGGVALTAFAVVAVLSGRRPLWWRSPRRGRRG